MVSLPPREGGTSTGITSDVTSDATSSARPSIEQVWTWLGEVPDPEIPVISLVDLGIVRGVEWTGDGDEATLVVRITPTYSGCPATQVIAGDVKDAMAAHGIPRVVIETSLSPAWTTDWLSDVGRERLRDYGIAPPGAREDVLVSLTRRGAPVATIACPRCGSSRTRLVSEFGSTPCKAHHACLECLEPFDYFKPI